MGLTPGTTVLLGALILAYGGLVGGTWMRRSPEKVWDTVSTITFIGIAALATIHLILVGARQAQAFDKARDRLDCVSEQLAAVRVQAPMPDCQVAWD